MGHVEIRSRVMKPGHVLYGFERGHDEIEMTRGSLSGQKHPGILIVNPIMKLFHLSRGHARTCYVVLFQLIASGDLHRTRSYTQVPTAAQENPYTGSWVVPITVKRRWDWDVLTVTREISTRLCSQHANTKHQQ